MCDELTATNEEVKLMTAVGNRVIAAEKITWTTKHVLTRRPDAAKVHAALIEELHIWLEDTTSIVKTIQTNVLGRIAGD